MSHPGAVLLNGMTSGKRIEVVKSSCGICCSILWFIILALNFVALFTIPHFWAFMNPPQLGGKGQIQVNNMPGLTMCAGPIDGHSTNGTLVATCSFELSGQTLFFIPVAPMSLGIIGSDGRNHSVNCAYVNTGAMGLADFVNASTVFTSSVACDVTVSSLYPYLFVAADNNLGQATMYNNFYEYWSLGPGGLNSGYLQSLSFIGTHQRRQQADPIIVSNWVRSGPVNPPFVVSGLTHQLRYRWGSTALNAFVEFAPFNFWQFLFVSGANAVVMYFIYSVAISVFALFM